MTMRLYHQGLLLGEIVDIETDWPWMMGTLRLTPDADAYKEFFAFMVNEDNSQEDPPFSEDFFAHWSIENERGEKREIDFPAVQEDNTISWRWG